MLAPRASLALGLAMLVSSADAMCIASTLPEYECQATHIGAVFHWKLAADATTVSMAVVCPQVGFCAFGPGGPGMVGATPIFGFVSGGTATLYALTITGFSTAGVSAADVSSASWVSGASVTEADGKTTTSYTYDIAAGGKMPDLSSVAMVMAHTATDGLGYHGPTRTRFTFNAMAKPPPPCERSALSGYECQATHIGAVFHWKLAADATTVSMAVVCPQVGYCAFGPGRPGMVGATPIFGFVSGGTATLYALTITARNGAGVSAADVSSASWVSGASVTEADGKTTTSYTYDIAAGGKMPDLSSVAMVMAHTNTDVLRYHGPTRTRFTFNALARPACLTCGTEPAIVQKIAPDGQLQQDVPPVFPLENFMPAWMHDGMQIFIYDCLPPPPTRGYFPEQNEPLPPLSEIRVTCPDNAENQPCEVLLNAYHCPACSRNKNGKWPQTLIRLGWRVGSCASLMSKSGSLDAADGWKMLGYQQTIGAGTTVVIPVVDVPLEHFAVFVLQCAVDCESVDPTGDTPDQCTCDGDTCRSSWCPPRPPLAIVPPQCERLPGCAPSLVAP